MRYALLIGAVWCAAASAESRYGVDLNGNILVAATPASCTLPTVHPLYSCGPIWIGKLDPSGQNLLFATYLSSSVTNAYTSVAGITADSSGNPIVLAHTVAPDLPTANAVQSSPKSQFTSLYIAKLSADGSRLIYATYLGGSGGQTALSLAVDGAGAAYIAAYTTSSGTAVAKLSPNGTLDYAITFPFEFYTDVKPIQVDATGSVLLVSNLQVVKISPDGSSLTREALPEWARPGRPFAVPRSTGGFVYAGTAGIGIPVTEQSGTDSGYVRIEDGQAMHPQLTAPVSGFAVDPQNRDRIYAATATGLFRSDNNGWTWSVLREGRTLAVAIDPFDSNRLYASADGSRQIYRSTDGGESWIAILRGPGGDPITSIAADPNVPGLLYAAGRAMYRSTNGGDTWDARSVGPSRPDMSPSASTGTISMLVQADPAHPGWAYVIGFTRCLGFCPVTQNVSRTQDGGNSWANATDRPDPLVSTFAKAAMAVDPFTGNVLNAVNQAAVVTLTGEVLYPAETTAVAFDPERAGTIYLAVHTRSGYFVLKSVDDGGSWSTVIQLDRPVYGLTVGAGGVLHASQTPDLPRGFVVVTDTLGAIQYGAYLGGAFTEINSVASSGGKVFVAGKTQGGLAVLNASQPAPAGGTDGFLAVFDESGALLWSTYLGGSGDDSIESVLPLPDGSVVVVGTTNSADFPAVSPPVLKDNSFVVRLSFGAGASGVGRGTIAGCGETKPIGCVSR